MSIIGFVGGLRRSAITGLDAGRDETEDGRGWIEVLPGGLLVPDARGRTFALLTGVNGLAVLKIGHQVLMGMQDADDFDPLPFPPIDHKMRPAEMNPHRWPELAMFTGHLGKLCEQVEDRKQTISIVLCLLDTPTGSPV